MRLTSTQVQFIKKTVDRVLGTPSQVWLFGSRADDKQRGGDIDMFIETQATLSNRADTICRTYGALIMALGDQKIDILLKDENTKEMPVFAIARRTGVLLLAR